MKHEWRKKEKELYLPKSKPEIVRIPKMHFITIEGEGNPGSEKFSSHIQALYGVAYTIKMSLKKETGIEGYKDFTVYPLEGEWDLVDEGRKQYTEGVAVVDLKDLLKYKLMIRQPSFISKEIFEKYKKIAFNKKKSEMIKHVNYEVLDEEEVCQMMHVGSYDSEVESFELMEIFVKHEGRERQSKKHKEIYITNPNNDNPLKQKTVLRFKIK